ncbi:MAG TPA: hypothetical protein VIK18_04395 [Pirellulales bacterium]
MFFATLEAGMLPGISNCDHETLAHATVRGIARAGTTGKSLLEHAF